MKNMTEELFINENIIVDAVCEFFNSLPNHTVKSKCYTHEHGIDVVVYNSKIRREIYVEAKGQTTSMISIRLGKEFLPGQKLSNWGKALLKILQLKSKYSNVKTVLAFPNDKQDMMFADSILPVIKTLDITILMINVDYLYKSNHDNIKNFVTVLGAEL